MERHLMEEKEQERTRSLLFDLYRDRTLGSLSWGPNVSPAHAEETHSFVFVDHPPVQNHSLYEFPFSNAHLSINFPIPETNRRKTIKIIIFARKVIGSCHADS